MGGTPHKPTSIAATEPAFALVAHGAKRTAVGDKVLEYQAGQHLVVPVDLPVVAEVIRASVDEPYLSVALALNPATIANLLLDRSAGDRGAADLPGLKVSECTTELLDAVARLLRLLDRQDDVAVLQPMLEREILWRLLAGVGYDSPSQFSREYRRLFGVPPGEDIKGMRTDSRQERSLA